MADADPRFPTRRSVALGPSVASPTLDRVRALLPELAEAADETEEARRLSARLVERLRDAGLFRMAVPKAYGGDALSEAQAVAVLEALATADAAAAWTGMVAFGFNVALSRYPAATIAEVYADGPDVKIRGGLAPTGKAVAVAGGYRLSGRWPFASGPFDAHWITAGAIVFDGDRPRMGPMRPDMRLFLVKPESIRFLDTWHTVGMRGSDSRDFVMEDVFVPEGRAANLFDFTAPSNYAEGALFDLPFPMLTGPTHSAVCLGIVRAALDDLAELARTKRSAFNPTQTLAESPVFQHRLAELACRYASLQALSDRQVADVERMAAEGEAATPFHLGRNASWVGYIHQQSTEIVNVAFELAGSTPVYSKSPLQRRWRDVRVAAQHVGGSVTPYATYGGLLAGQAPAAPGAH